MFVHKENLINHKEDNLVHIFIGNNNKSIRKIELVTKIKNKKCS